MITQNTGQSDMLNAIMNENTNIKIVIYIIFSPKIINIKLI